MASVECNDDYYLILEIPNTATLEVVTKSYRRLAKVRHPDRNLGTAKSTAEFQRLQRAYDTISDPEKRRAYDIRRAGIRDNVLAQREDHGRQAETAERGKKRASEEKVKTQREYDTREERLEDLRLSKSKCNNDIFELSRVVRKLKAECKCLQDQDEEDSEKEKERDGWWTYLASPIYGRVKEGPEQKKAREIERFHRIAAKRIKESELQRIEIMLQNLQNRLQCVDDLIAVEMKKAEDETLERTRTNRLRREEKEKKRAQQELREQMAKIQKAQAERVAKVAREAKVAHEARKALERQWMEAAAKRLKAEAEERAQQVRAQQVRAQQEREEQQRTLQEQAQQQQAQQQRAQQERAQQVRAQQQRAQQERAAEGAAQKAKNTQTYQFEHTAPPFSCSTASGPTENTCQHEKYWPKREGTLLCSNCKAVHKNFAFQCRLCGKIACSRCRQVLRKETWNTSNFSS